MALTRVLPEPAFNNNVIRDFLSAVTGTVIGLDQVLSPDTSSYVSSVRNSVIDYGLQLISTCLFGVSMTSDNPMCWNRAFELFSDLTSFAKQHDGFTIDEAIDHLASIGRLGEEVDGLRDKRRQIIVAALGWLTGLYSAIPPTEEWMFHLRFRDSGLGDSSLIQPAVLCERPFSELLDILLHSFLPDRLTDRLLDDSISKSVQHNHKAMTGTDLLATTDFMVDHLNAAALVYVGGLTIVWTNSIRMHLAFDVVQKTVILYSQPSVCRISQESDSLLYRFALKLTW